MVTIEKLKKMQVLSAKHTAEVLALSDERNALNAAMSQLINTNPVEANRRMNDPNDIFNKKGQEMEKLVGRHRAELNAVMDQK